MCTGNLYIYIFIYIKNRKILGKEKKTRRRTVNLYRNIRKGCKRLRGEEEREPRLA